MDTKKIAIIGGENIGKTVAIEYFESAKQNNDVCVLSDILDSQFSNLGDPKPFLITKLPELPEIWIDPKEPVFNYKKHKQTCDKKRKARKKKKHR